MLENWSLRRGGHLREVVATRGSTVLRCYQPEVRRYCVVINWDPIVCHENGVIATGPLLSGYTPFI